MRVVCYCDNGGYCCAIAVTHTGAKSGCKLVTLLSNRFLLLPGLHKLWYPSIRDTSTWSKFGAHGEHGDIFLFSNLGVL